MLILKKHIWGFSCVYARTEVPQSVPKKTCAVCNAVREIVLKNVVLAANLTEHHERPLQNVSIENKHLKIQ